MTGPNPNFNELFHIDVKDPEMEQIIIRFSNGKKHTTQGSGKAYIGEIKIELREITRANFNSPLFEYKWFPVMFGSEQYGEARLYLEFTDLRVKTCRGPSNVIHLGHIGVQNGTFSAKNLPPEWKESLKKAGVRKKDLNNPELRDLLFGIILKEEGGEEALEQHEQRADTQVTQKPVPTTPQNHTPTQTLPQSQSLPQSQTPPQTRGTPPAVKPSDGEATKKGAPPAMKRGNAPPGPKKDGGGPPVIKSSAPTIATNSDRPQASAPTGDIFSEIQGGNFHLSSAKDRKIVNELPQEPQGLTSALEDALKSNRVFLSGGLDNNDDDESSDWD